ncbi:DUF1203 domain-containing protein [Tabrizicola piscis]|uniref:DUF1203 domain-containing protein n=1 Tax=Tabrizicola piscis TaxID=2494374 RepID=A0A3S8U841_9RHOB|nr:DUF1203 domain-containing protein [Tabrizicola piscis]AZL59892.1 DUF1203 domain-containing protein [Tabrizicola piscis]
MRFVAIPTDVARHYQAGGADANGQVPERQMSDGGGNPCRHCLKLIPAGEAMLVLAHRPFPKPQPYAEVGPIFLCAAACDQGGGEGLPEILASTDYIVRGYGDDDRIVYGTGGVVETGALMARAETLLQEARVAYVHVRSARNNCFQCRIDR